MVKWEKLDDLCSKITDGSHYSPKSVEEGYFMPSVKDMTTNGFDYSSCKKISEDDYLSLIKTGCKPKINDVLVAKDGSMLKYVFPFLKEENIVVLSSIAILTPKTDVIDSRYLSFYLLRSDVKEQTIREFSSKGGVPRIILKNFKKIRIPIPSLSEQQQIVGFLDTFTASIDNLKEQIAQRRKQYEYYRDQLLDLEGKEGVEMKTLGEVCNIKGRIGFRGYTREDQVEKGEGVISLSPGNIENGQMVYNGCTYISWEKYEESPEIKIFNGDILFCKTGSTVGKVAMVKELPCEATINPQLVVLKNITIESQFLNYILGTYKIQSIVKRLAGVGSVPNISQEKLCNLEIQIPSLSEQQRIVSILDTFEASIQNLEAQLSQREKQYEYYRNKLLTFE